MSEKVETTQVKKWWQSKTIWAGVTAVLVAAYNAASESFGLAPIPEFVYALLGAFGIYGRVAAKQGIGEDVKAGDAGLGK
jgi:hypothetical protein